MMFVRLLGFSDELIADLIVAWIGGRTIGPKDAAASWTKRPPEDISDE
ncbi:hypothetical protein [Bradyrhizobium betae]|jgi:hypothetical protein|nr:hypothetical protein [Bradyrhizobium betae]MCS3727295.1 hypothetical protein [Bradyrhizobium betae]